MDTAHKLGVFFAEEGIDIKVMGIPKTIDNDLPCTDHTPGFGSAAKYIATSILEIIRDTQVYNLPSVTIVEIMGRNAGWLTAASVLPHVVGEKAPHLVYLPEVPFDPDQFIEDIKAAQLEHKAVLVAVSEGVKTAEGRYVAESVQDETVDAFGHKTLTGTARFLVNGQVVGETYLVWSSSANRDVVDRKGLGDLWDFLQGRRPPPLPRRWNCWNPRKEVPWKIACKRSSRRRGCAPAARRRSTYSKGG